jgi:hypothetical protein
MTTLLNALQTEDTTTLNGMVTNSTSKDANVDLFFHIGAMRGKDPVPVFAKAFAEDPLTALKVMFWCRDVRGGAGERQLFKDVVIYLSLVNQDVLKKNMHLFSLYGRWDDLFVLLGTPLEDDVLNLIGHGLTEGDGLLAKWLPRKGPIANKVRKYLGVSPKVYRKTIVGMSQTVEQSMCAKKFEDIDYEKVPSLAMSRYLKAFYKNDELRFDDFKNRLAEGTAKVNAGALYPYDVTKSILCSGDVKVAEAQWDSLPNYMEGNEKRVLPVVDTSGSMDCSVGGNPNLTCMDVAISLGLYISERNEGPFKDAFITFSEDPTLQYLKGTLAERLASLNCAHWGFNTNLEKVFQVVLKQALKHQVSPGEMPTDILILSDMNFDEAIQDSDYSAYAMAKHMYGESGYELPNIIFWNLHSHGTQSPVSFDEKGTALISGFSPSILKSVLAGENISPLSIMMETIGSDRYDLVTI